MPRLHPAWLVILGGVCAALHVGKLPPAIPVLREALGISLVEAGFLLSLVQLAGMALGLPVGLAADGLGLKRTMVVGLSIVGLASMAGGFMQALPALFVLRGLEGLGFLLASMPAPGLIRRLVQHERTSAMLGVWGAYMPFATAAALLLGPAFIAAAGWPGWWQSLGLLSLGAAVLLAWRLPPDPLRGSELQGVGWVGRLRWTLASPGPWLVALTFAVYSAQWLAVIGFLPSLYGELGLPMRWAAVATASAAAVNMAGNIASGRLLQQGVRPQALLYVGFATMGVATIVAFAPLPGQNMAAVAGVRYAAILVFSAVGGLIPGTLFSLAVRLAPGESTVSTTVGWMQQWSALGQLLGPPAMAWIATVTGGWQGSWWLTAGCACAGLLLAWAAGRTLREHAP
ncbi:MAG TPA: MFS transporter [Ramlibacter sp.]|nr:MFS transporter [Ramlibacter sp.]